MNAAQAKLAVGLLQSANKELTAECASLSASNAELLAALKAVISECEYVGSDGWMTGNVHSDEWNQARAAIAKAVQS